MDSLQKCCLSYWYPAIAGRVPTPKTHWIRLANGRSLIAMLDGETPRVLDYLDTALNCLVWEIGTPCFLRTGHGSGKHNWSRCCYVADGDRLKDHIYHLVEWSNTVDLVGLPHDVWVARKLLDTAPLFRCRAYDGFPVVREWRYFVDGERLLYGQPYWPEGALEQGAPDDPDWRRHLPALAEEPGPEVERLAKTAGKAVGGLWSVDVLQLADGKWCVTDMAVAQSSYGWRGDDLR